MFFHHYSSVFHLRTRIRVAALGVAVFASTQAFSQRGFENVGLDTGNFITAGRFTAFLVNEARQAGTDLNGDTDTDDDVLHIYDAVTRDVTNVGLHARFLYHFDGERAVFGITEEGQGIGGGTDLNGDGDKADDRVLHVYDVASGVTTNLRLQVSGSSPVADGPTIVFGVDERFHNVGSLNGDSDSLDAVIHVFDATTGTTINLGRAVSGFRVNGNLVTFRVPEDMQGDGGGTDLNGDGVAFRTDLVLHVYDTRTLGTTNVGLAVSDFTSDGDIVVFQVSELAQGGSFLNSDPDAFDLVVHYLDAASGLPATNLAIAGQDLHIDGNHIVFAVPEFAERRDLNGDTDSGFLDGDAVLHAYDLATGTLRNVGLDAQDLALTGDLVSFNVKESRQANTDLNGDSDTGDEIAHAVELDPAGMSVPVNLRRHSFNTVNDGENVAFVAHEVEQGADLNGDGDEIDRVPHIWNRRTGVLTNTRIASFGLSLSRGRLVFAVGEFFEGNMDLNGDGDSVDLVAHLFDGRTGRMRNLGLASAGLRISGRFVSMGVSEDRQGATDFNSDGDAGDTVLHVSGLLPILIEILIDAVSELDISNGLETALGTKLDTALEKLLDAEVENDSAAEGALGAFIRLVEAQEGKKIDPADAAELIAAAQDILDAL